MTMATQVSVVSSSTGPTSSSHQEGSNHAEVAAPLGPVQENTVSSTTGDHDPEVVAALLQLMEILFFPLNINRYNFGIQIQ